LLPGGVRIYSSQTLRLLNQSYVPREIAEMIVTP
jgi:hypothetical protein